MKVGKYYVLIAEGITDCSLLEAILEKYLGYTQYEKVDHLPELFKEMIGKECCAKDKDIQEFYADKVQFGAISTVLKPDKPVRFSIKDKLIRTGYKASYMEIAEFKMLYDFLQNNLEQSVDQ